MAVVNVTQHYGTPVVMDVTNLQSLGEDHATPFDIWQSVMVDFKTAVKPLDCELFVKLTTADSAPANDKCFYIYICSWFYDGSVWSPSSMGSTTLPTGTEGKATGVLVEPNSLRLLDVIPYSTQHMTVQKSMFFRTIFPSMPDGWSAIIRNNSGAALATGCIVDYTPITQDLT